ncbi:hypothetical protein ASPBRDRAFT_119094 [Aspergillus brasiliensis CBS 101740]|uniref:Carboxylic ester hydrolase n=1 Tax=Aspergillus brasiliensis (strain CBS 101740 / IMI 381727 / IBT 21946) TaxID=767769 RepID=A0A1L9URN4_ASPBC|nr:hypothetical protein ASPBRDRAFT_119094 [Aspergillus brasiliensis CBS 101740]
MLLKISRALVFLVTVLSAFYAHFANGYHIPEPVIPGLKILLITAFPLQNYTTTAVQVNPIQSLDVTISFWNVTVTYTHPGWDDLIHAHVWVPLSGWNNRLQAVGGGGWAGLLEHGTLAFPVYQGFAAAGSDMGHDRNPWSARSWALDDASGHVNYARLVDFFSTCLNELALLAKYVIQQIYGSPPAYSYWNGCSTGGRQGLEIAQRWPEAFDGIVAGAPAINWAQFVPANYWPTFVMNQLGTYPHPCVMEKITKAAIAYCDGQDGVLDGIIALPALCNFNPLTLLGNEVWCECIPSIITMEVAILAGSYWEGLIAEDETPLWYGFNHGTPWNYTVCTSTDDIGNHRCHSLPDYLSVDWLQLFVAQDPDLDLVDMNQAAFESLFHRSVAGYKAITDANNPDLYDFKTKGGKIIHWHGLSDWQVPPKGSVDYYGKVQLRDPSVQDFYLYFEAPGVEHCGHGKGAAPTGLMESLIAWVEGGIAPEYLRAVSEDGRMSRILCPYPATAQHVGGDPTVVSSFVCQ